MKVLNKLTVNDLDLNILTKLIITVKRLNEEKKALNVSIKELKQKHVNKHKSVKRIESLLIDYAKENRTREVVIDDWKYIVNDSITNEIKSPSDIVNILHDINRPDLINKLFKCSVKTIKANIPDEVIKRHNIITVKTKLFNRIQLKEKNVVKVDDNTNIEVFN
jgi:hypothetical protein